MGYRSDVAYTIRFTDTGDNTLARQSFYTFLAEAKCKPETASCFSDDEDMRIDEKLLQINFFANSVKWYPEYDDVKCHELLLHMAQDWVDNKDAEGVIGYWFLRIGEESNDIEESYGGNWNSDWIQLHRSMELDWDTSPK